MENLFLMETFNVYSEYILNASSEIIFLMTPSSPSKITTGLTKIIADFDVLSDKATGSVLKPKSDGGQPGVRVLKIIGTGAYKASTLWGGVFNPFKIVCTRS